MVEDPFAFDEDAHPLDLRVDLTLLNGPKVTSNFGIECEDTLKCVASMKQSE